MHKSRCLEDAVNSLTEAVKEQTETQAYHLGTITRLLLASVPNALTNTQREELLENLRAEIL